MVSKLSRLRRGIKRGVFFKFLKYYLIGGLKKVKETPENIIFQDRKDNLLWDVPKQQPYTKDYIYSVNPSTELSISPFFKINSGIFIDIGAFAGKYSLSVAKNAPNVTVYGIEPNTISREVLTRNISLNSLESQITIVPYAITETDGEFPFSQEGSISHLGTSNTEEKVKGITFETLIGKYKIPLSKISLIKIDVEGVEFQIIKQILEYSEQLNPKLKIICEILEKQENKIEIFKFIKSKNYKIIRLDQNNVMFIKN